MKLDPGDGESQLLLIDVLRQTGQIDDAMQVLNKAIAKEPNNPVYELNFRGSAHPSSVVTTRRSNSSRACSNAMPTTTRSCRTFARISRLSM